MKLTHNENIKTLEYAMRHLELEEDRLMASKTSANAYMVDSISQSGKWHKRKYQGGNHQEGKGDA